MDKVKLPKEVAEALTYFYKDADVDFPQQAIMKVAMDDVRYIGDPDQCQVIKEFAKLVVSLNDLMKALVNGYEVEETPEDKVRGFYRLNIDKSNSFESSDADIQYHTGVYKGVIKTLELLNMTIEGVNA